jgi:type IV pilus assembly protein PilN
MFDQMVSTLPPGLYLSDFVQKGSSISISGTAESNARVSAYMRNLDASPWFANSRLQVITTKNTPIGKVSEFKLTVQQSSPSDKKKDGKGN